MIVLKERIPTKFGRDGPALLAAFKVVQTREY
jgi:hypothetical protein